MDADELKNLNEPKTYREMFLKIMYTLDTSEKERQKDRESVEKFIQQQTFLCEKTDERIDALERMIEVQATRLDAIEVTSKKWDIGSYFVGAAALITAIFNNIMKGN